MAGRDQAHAATPNKILPASRAPESWLP